MDDLLGIDDLLTEDERQVRDSVHQFIDDQFIPIINQCFESARFPQEIIPQIAKLGLLGMSLPEQYGGSHAHPVTYGLVCQELERGDSGLRSFVSVQNSLVMFPIFKYGSEEQKQRWLPVMSRGEVIGCFGLTEAESGSDPAACAPQQKKLTMVGY